MLTSFPKLTVMKNLLFFLFAATGVSFLHAQRTLPVYAITADDNNLQWLNIKVVDIAKGQVLSTVFNAKDKQVHVLKTASDNNVSKQEEDEIPTGTMVAAAAFSRAQSKFFFIPMRIAELRWADLSKGTPVYYALQSPVLSKLNMNDAANHFTRMCMGADGKGYALTNDGKHLIQFTADNQVQVQDLGALVDAPVNNSISIHNQCTSWGGDMIAAADGKLLIISQRSYVFQFSPKDRIVTLLGQINNLPQNFTTNGAAVDENGNLIIACSNGNFPYYKVDLSNFTANPAFTQIPTGMNASDLASNYLLRKQATNNGTYIERINKVANSKISMYPNPVTSNRVQLIFDDVEKGEYSIQLIDVSGKLLINKIVTISGNGQISYLDLHKAMSKGMYLVKVLNHDLKTVFADKVAVQ